MTTQIVNKTTKYRHSISNCIHAKYVAAIKELIFFRASRQDVLPKIDAFEH